MQSVVRSLRHLDEPPRRWLVSGGGRLNAAIMRGLQRALGVAVAVEPIEALGATMSGDFIEAQCFGYLAVRSYLGLALSVPSTTGVPQPLTGGVLAAAV